MKTVKKTLPVFIVLLIIALAASCASTGQYKPLADGETVIGTAQTTFMVQSSFFSMKKVQDAMNAEAYIKLMEVAAQKYPGSIDLRDIVWVTGDKSRDGTKTEIFATGKVIRIE